MKKTIRIFAIVFVAFILTLSGHNLDDTFPYIYIEPGKSYSCKNYNLSNYEVIGNNRYALEFEIFPGYKLFKAKNGFTMYGEFVYK